MTDAPRTRDDAPEPPDAEQPPAHAHAAEALAGEALAGEARAGSRLALSRLLTAVENRSSAAEAALRLLFPLAGEAHLVGITGPPGAGKSTLVAALVAHARAAGRTVAVLAIDPSSPITGGAILGDRVRMQQYAGDDGVFIRSMAARGHVGGLAGTTAEAATVLDASGFGLIFIETVGTGQSEVEVASVADTTVVVQAPEGGDEVQALKAGLLEVADIVVVNKSDRPGADRAASQLRAMLTVGAAEDRAAGDRPRPKRPTVLLASGLAGAGTADLLAVLDRRHEEGSERTVPDRARLSRARAQVRAIVTERILAALEAGPRRTETAEVVAMVASHELDPYAAADRLLEGIREHD